MNNISFDEVSVIGSFANPYKYKFNGKELDEETGLYYYGARYYDPRVSIWLSVDPLAEKFPGVSPYAFCNNNPLYFVDPTGMAPTDWYRNNVTGAVAWRDGSSKISGYTNLGFSVSNQSFGKNKTDHLVMDGSTKLITVNGNTIADFSKGSSGSLIKSGFTIWGDDRSGDTTGQKGTTTDSMESSDIPNIGGSAGKIGEASGLGKIMDIVKNFLEGLSATDGVKDRVEKIVNIAKSQKEEPKAVKNDTTEVLYYGGKNGTLQKTEKSLNGKVVKVEKND